MPGCATSPLQSSPVWDTSVDVLLSPGQNVGQTFVAEYAGLHGLSVWLDIPAGDNGEIILHLRSDPHDVHDVLKIRLPLQDLRNNEYTTFSFPTQINSTAHRYYVFFEVSGVQQGLQIPVQDLPEYADGALYINHVPVDYYLIFQPTYDLAIKYSYLLQEFTRSLGWLILAGFLFVTPGLAIVSFYPDKQKLVLGEVMGISIGMSVAFYPLFFLWMDVLHLRIGAMQVWLPLFLALILLIIRFRAWQVRIFAKSLKHWCKKEMNTPNLIYLLLLILLIITRFTPMRLVEIPYWGDSLQHTTIVQLMFDHQGLFESWLPYAPYDSLSVHFGFHANAAIWGWASGFDAARSVFFTGQLMNVFAVLALYPLAYRLSDGQRWSGTFTLLFAGLVSPMPAFYVNWGRYPQLAGLVILPVALMLIMQLLEYQSISKWLILTTGLSLAGMGLCYYRTPYFMGVFVIPWVIWIGFIKQRWTFSKWIQSIARGGAAAVSSVMIAVPWAFRLQDTSLAGVISNSAGKSAAVQTVLQDYIIWREIAVYVPPLLIALFFAGWIWSLRGKKGAVSILVAWVVGLGSLVAGRLVGIPGATAIKNFGVLISLYIPVGLTVSWFIGAIFTHVVSQKRRLAALLILLGCLGLTFLGMVYRLQDLDPAFAMVTRSDLQAMSWINEHIPENAVFMIEGFRNSTGRMAAGSDAGWWIPVLTKRQNTIPPQYAMLNERAIDPTYRQQVVDLIIALERNTPSSTAGFAAICSQKVTHVYIGQRQGQVGVNIAPLFSPGDFINQEYFKKVYQFNNVWIFEVDREQCPTY
ncbi:MAG: hypothetical protein P1S60_08590 [Anaerolineae bacterium]|nr:hypothetical protein [Anaerolineae bacterium]